MADARKWRKGHKDMIERRVAAKQAGIRVQ
jgi:hypothetical protein